MDVENTSPGPLTRNHNFRLGFELFFVGCALEKQIHVANHREAAQALRGDRRALRRHQSRAVQDDECQFWGCAMR